MQPVVATTPTQFAFAIGILLLTPVVGAFGASLQRSRGRGAMSGFLLASGASWGGWIVGAFTAIALFPEYPGAGRPSEPVAMLFVLPGLLGGASALRWLATRGTVVRPPGRARRVGLGAAVVLAALLAVGGVLSKVEIDMWPAMRALPEGAVVLEETALMDTFLGDYTYTLRARMSESEFREWMRRLDVEPTEDPSRYGAPRDGVEPECGRRGRYVDGVGAFRSWCS